MQTGVSPPPYPAPAFPGQPLTIMGAPFPSASVSGWVLLCLNGCLTQFDDLNCSFNTASELISRSPADPWTPHLMDKEVT